MLVYFDTKDLINIFEKSQPFSSNHLYKILEKGNHKLVFSMSTIMEISEPLLHKNAKTIVTRLLNRIEKLPHTYIHESIIPRLEYMEAVSAFCEGREVLKIDPFARRFDEIVDLNRKPATNIYINYPLSEIVWDLYCYGSLGGLDKYAKKLRSTFEADRALSPKPTLEENFIKTVALNLKLHKVKHPTEDIESLAKWIYSNPQNCPSERLSYEVWHKIVKNITDKPEESDLEDFQHIGCLPYVDLLTTDRRMNGYVSQVSASISINYNAKCFFNAKKVIGIL
jgi:hypothetical protein